MAKSTDGDTPGVDRRSDEVSDVKVKFTNGFVVLSWGACRLTFWH